MKDKLERNKILLLLVALTFTLISMSGSSYALYVNRDYGDEEKYTTGLLDLTFDESTTLSLVNNFPISDEEGKASTPYYLTVTNTGNLTYKFDIMLLETTSDNLIDKKYIKIMINDEEVHTLESSNILSKDITLVPGDKKKISIRMWLSEDTPNSEQNKNFSAKATTNGYALYTTGLEKPETASDKIISLSEVEGSKVYGTNSYTDSDGNTKYHDYRYIGSNVNNYVKFNNDMYRIIGVFDNITHGKDGYLVKLISANVMGGSSWGIYHDSSGTYKGYNNDWAGNNNSGIKSNLNILLNEYFLKPTSATLSSCSAYTYFYSNAGYKTEDCTDILGYSIEDSNPMIETVTWHLYGPTTTLTKVNTYTCERGTNTTSCAVATNGAESVSAKMGLMYSSDYLYASGYYKDNTTITSSDNGFGNDNWLYKGYEWTITPYGSASSTAWYVYAGYLYYNRTSYPLGWRPSFYLNSNIKISGGQGTFNDPYILEEA